MRSRQRGASLALVVLALALVVAGLLALRSVTRTTDRDVDRNKALSKMARAQEALVQYAAANRRLPCPADPTLSTGVEVPTVPLTGLCTNIASLGTLPWATLGMKAEDGLDPWGVKLSYAVYNAGLNPLTTTGLDMTACDTKRTGSPDALGKCESDHTTGTAKFLANKGLRIREPANPSNSDHTDAAYVILSHGPTGQGGFLVNNAQRAMPASAEERANAQPTTTFWILPWSGSDVEASDKSHFDDLAVYATLEDFIAKIGLGGRVWPIPGEVAGTRATFDATTVGAALGRAVSPGDLGTASIAFGSITALTFASPNLGLGTITLADGSVMQGLGIAGGGNAVLSSTAGGTTNGVFAFQFGQPVRHFGVALAGFGKNGVLSEQVEFRFYNVSGSTLTQVGGPVQKGACLLTGDFTTLSVKPTVSQNFNAVQITPLPSTGLLGPGATAFLVAQTIACDSTASSCYPPLSNAANRC